MILNGIDIGGNSNPYLLPVVGQSMGSALVYGSRTIIWPEGALVEQQQNITFWVTAWQALGGGAAGSFAAVRYLMRQLEELVQNPDLSPIYIQWSATAQPGQYSSPDPHDGWYILTDFEPDYSSFAPSGWIQVKQATAQQVGPGLPSPLAVAYVGGTLATNYAGPATPLVAVPIGAGQGPSSGGFVSRTGAEGGINCYLSPPVNPVPFNPPATVAGLFTGQARVFDTVVSGGNAVPTTGAYTNANWVEVLAANHEFAGDCVLTNGLLLLHFQTGLFGAPDIWFWNTQLATPAWQHQGFVLYLDPSSNNGTLQQITLERVDPERCQIRVMVSTSAGNWVRLIWKLERGMYHAPVELWPLTAATTSTTGLNIVPSITAQFAFTETNALDQQVDGAAGIGGSTPNYGYEAMFGQQANGPLFGWLLQNKSSNAQGYVNSSGNLVIGDVTPVGTFARYALWVTPFATAPNLQAEAESGVLGTGWTNIVDAAARGGHAAQVASGTLSGNADLFGTAWVPPAGVYDVWVRIKVSAQTSAVAQMQIGLWDATLGAFVASTTFAPNNAALFTQYLWARVASSVTPTAGHNMQFRAVTTATTDTVWTLDEAVLAPKVSASVGVGNLPGDIWSQFLSALSRRWVRG